MRTERKVELLAPAGSPEGFYGALHAGADAVYLGGSRFGARAYADNFTEEELVACIRYAHILGKRVYLTANTLVKEAEFPELHPWLAPFYEAGLDGVIVQDIGVFAYIRQHFPGLSLHVSTQMNLTGTYGAAYLKKLGAARIVPARELSLVEIKEIKQKTGLELECFVHGAMCYCYSGQCLFSSILGGRSGNRGRCAQPCRLPYKVELEGRVTKECYPLSLKDMCTIEHLPELIQAGIDSFKIEGRMKKPEYAAGVTAIYRKYIDRFYAGEDCHVSEEDLRALSRLYLRSERQDGYYYRNNGRDMVTLQNPSYQGTDDELSDRLKAAYIEAKPRIPLEMRLEFAVGKPAKVTCFAEGERVTVSGEIVTLAQKQPVTEENIRKQMGKLGGTLFYIQNMDIQLTEKSFYPLKALNELRRQAVARVEDCLIEKNGLSYEGRYSYEDRHPHEDRQEEPGTIISEAHLSEMMEHIREPKNKEVTEACRKACIKEHAQSGEFHVLVRTVEQFRTVAEMLTEENGQGTRDIMERRALSRIYLEADLVLQLDGDVGKTQPMDTARQLGATQPMDTARQLGATQPMDTAWQLGATQPMDVIRQCELVIALPQILRRRDEPQLEKVWEIFQARDVYCGFLVRSMDGMGFLDAHPSQKKYKVFTDAGFYTWNLESLQAIPTDGFCLPYELKAADQRRLLECHRQNAETAAAPETAEGGDVFSAEKIVYGYIPLMHTANCVYNTINGCGQKQQEKSRSTELCYLTDRYRKRFPVLTNCQNCVNIIYNCVPLSLHREIAKWQKWRTSTAFRLDFTMEDAAGTSAVLSFFLSGCKGEPPFAEYTSGHEKRGAE